MVTGVSLQGSNSRMSSSKALSIAHAAKSRASAGRLVLHNVIAFEFLLCSAACVALGGLLLWHIRLVHRGETSIEVHTNRQEATRQHKLGLVSRLTPPLSISLLTDRGRQSDDNVGHCHNIAALSNLAWDFPR